MTVSLKNLIYSYTKDATVLNNISYDFLPSNIYIIKGENGSGKSTLIKALTGIILTDGVYYTDGLTPPLRLNSKKFSKIRKDIACLMQNPAHMLFAATVREELRFVYELEGTLTREVENEIDRLLNLFKLDGFAHRFPQSLSGGEIQKLALAAVFLKDSGVVILDEPSSALDTESKKLLAEMLVERSREKVTIIATHDEDFVNLLQSSPNTPITLYTPIILLTMREGRLCV
jgi:energy-coupling factor transporter ATP-binding protein EcfA2